MKEIKTRDTVKDIRTLDRAANVADRIKTPMFAQRSRLIRHSRTMPTPLSVMLTIMQLRASIK